jgi:dTDP-4-dehydrorhamnose reductase
MNFSVKAFAWIARRTLSAARPGPGQHIIGLTCTQLDIACPATATSAVAVGRPDVMVNRATWTVVDDTEAWTNAAGIPHTQY